LVPRPREKRAKRPPPTPAQIAALAELQKEAALYEKDAKDYRRTMTRIIRHHYEEKRRRILESLDREIGIESKDLRTARAEAIRRLEAFVAKYSGKNAHEENTPDAMFRLGALYEERAREVLDDALLKPGAAPPEPDLKPAVALYKRIVREFPKYRELAGVFYYLGHAYNDMGRLEEAQQVWRSLVCRNRYAYPVPPDPSDPSKDSIARLPQDHDGEWWLGWLSRHPEPLDEWRAKRKKSGDGDDTAATVIDDENSYLNPYPQDCRAIPQKLLAGEAPRYIAEIWWRIGDHHFDEIDVWGGPYNLNRAESAYHRAMRIKKPPVFDVAMYKLAWTYFKQQRYRTAVGQFVELLHLTDAREKSTGNAGADFRNEAYAYIAGSVTYIDFDGPGPDDPYIARNDVFDLYSDPAQIEQEMHVALDRIKDPNLIPQDKKWTVEIYKALAYEFKEYGQLHNLIELDELILAKWPLHRDAPFVQNQIADVYEQLAGQARGAEHQKYARKALEARGKLINYVEQPDVIPEWVEANKEDPEAIRAAERLVRGGLRRAAADHTNAARRLVALARSTDDPADKVAAFDRALGEYRNAARAWGGYLMQDENAEDAYESRYWLADSYVNIVFIKVQLDQMPTAEEIAIAQKTARDVRDSNEDDKYLQPAGLMVVKVAQQVTVANYKAHAAGTGGFPERKAVETEKYEENGETKERVVKVEVPKPLTAMIAAFDEYIARVPVEADPYKNHDNFAYQSGEIPFLYGQFEEAKRRLNPIYQTQCGKTKYGYQSWLKLVTMANLEGDFDRSLVLSKAAKKKSCAYDDATRIKEANISGDTIKTGFYKEAYKAFQAAQGMEDGPEKNKMWIKAAVLYEEALKEAPSHTAAPEAAINGAIAYKQLGNYDKAIGMYELFIKEYGNDDNLTKVRDGDKDKGTAPDPKQYKTMVGYLKTAYGALADAYVLFFDYRRAAQTFDKISTISHFDPEDQRTGARNAVFLYANIGDRTKVAVTKKRFFDMKPAPPKAEKAELEWLIAEADVKEWDERSPDRGDNKAARARATGTMDGFYRKWSSESVASKYSVQAAYWSAKLRRAGKDAQYKKWCKQTRDAFDKYKGVAKNDEKGRSLALGSLQADMAAECHYRDIDEQLKKNFDYDAGHHRYAGVITDVTEKFKDDVETVAKGWFDKLQEVIDKYQSRPWAVAARARQGSLYDSCRTGLYNTRPPGLKMFTKKEDKLLKQLDDLCVNQGNEKACLKYDSFTANRRTKWWETRDNYLADADKAMVAGYGTAIIWAREWRVRVDAVDHAIGRLAFFTDIIGDAKLRQYTSVLKNTKGEDFVYNDGMFLRMRRGMNIPVPTKVLTVPLPANPN